MEPFTVLMLAYGAIFAAAMISNGGKQRTEEEMDKRRWRKEMMIEDGVLEHPKRE